MRIAFLAQPFDKMEPPVRSGSLAMWIYYMARLCAQRGHSVTVFGNNGGRLAGGHTRHDDVDYLFPPRLTDSVINSLVALSSAAGRRLGLMKGRSKHSASGSLHHWGYAREAALRARALESDVVHIMNYSQFVPVVRRHHPRARIALHMQCEWLTQFPRREIEPRIREADLVIGCSKYITKTIARAYPEFAEKCVTVPNSADVVEVEALDACESKKQVLFVGRLSPEKGLHDLIAAFHQVLMRVPDAQLRLVGGAGSAPFEYLVGLSDVPFVKALSRFYEPPGLVDGKDPYLATLEELAGAELGKRIVFEGNVPHNEIERHYREAALVVNPSLSESFGISLVEAMMHGLPVVATRIGGMQYTVEDRRTGYLVDPARPDELAEAICRILEDPRAGMEMGKAGRLRAIEGFSWQSAADSLIGYYEGKLL